MRDEFKTKIAGYAKGDKDDQVSLFQIVDWIERTFKVADTQQLKSYTLEFVKDALEVGFQAGEFSQTDHAFKIWENQDSNKVCSYIEKEWLALARKPVLGEIIWFVPPGYEYA